MEELEEPFDFTCRFRKMLEEDGYHFDQNESGPKASGQWCILASPHGVWFISGVFCHTLFPTGVLCANGSGENYAYGAGHLARNLNHKPKKILAHALQAAMHFDTHCGGQMIIKELR